MHFHVCFLLLLLKEYDTLYQHKLIGLTYDNK